MILYDILPFPSIFSPQKAWGTTRVLSAICQGRCSARCNASASHGASQQHLPLWSVDLLGTLWPTAARQARPLGDSGGWHAVCVQYACEFPRLNPSATHSSGAVHLPQLLSNVLTPHHLHKNKLLAKPGHQPLEDCKHSSCQAADLESRTVYCCCSRTLQHCHHCEEALCERPLQKSVCMKVLHPKVECRIVRTCCLRKLQHCHHFEKELCESHLQKPVCIKVLHPKVECCIVRTCCLRKILHCHHFEEALCASLLQKPVCMKVQHSKVECCIVRKCCLRKLQQCHHCEEALYESHLQKPVCMKVQHPKVECCIVRKCCLRKLQQCHHCEEALYESHLQKPVCMKVQHPKVECCIVHQCRPRTLQQCHHCEEALYESHLQKPVCMKVQHPKLEQKQFRWRQHDHHFEAVQCQTCPQIPSGRAILLAKQIAYCCLLFGYCWCYYCRLFVWFFLYFLLLIDDVCFLMNRCTPQHQDQVS